MLQHTKRQVKLFEMHCFTTFTTALCVIFLMEMLADVIATSCLTDKRICVRKASCFTNLEKGQLTSVKLLNFKPLAFDNQRNISHHKLPPNNFCRSLAKDRLVSLITAGSCVRTAIVFSFQNTVSVHLPNTYAIPGLVLTSFNPSLTAHFRRTTKFKYSVITSYARFSVSLFSR